MWRDDAFMEQKVKHPNVCLVTSVNLCESMSKE